MTGSSNPLKPEQPHLWAEFAQQNDILLQKQIYNLNIKTTNIPYVMLNYHY